MQIGISTGLTRLGSGEAAPFNPASIEDLTIWLDASDASTLTIEVGDKVSQWRDKSGNGYHATQVTPANYPDNGDDINGINAINFSGTDQSLTFSNAIRSIVTQRPYTYFIVYAPNASTQNHLFSVSQGGSDNFKIQENHDGLVSTNGSQTSASGPSSTVTTTGHIVTTWSSSDALWVAKDGLPGDESQVVGDTVTNNGIFLGRRDSSGEDTNCRIAYLLLYKRALTQAEIHYVENNLARLYGVTLTRTQSEVVFTMTPENPEDTDDVEYTLRLVGPLHKGSITITQSGGLDDSYFDTTFTDALQTAVDATEGVAFDGVDTLSFSSRFPNVMTWSRTMTSDPVDEESHIVRIAPESGLRVRTPTALVMANPDFPASLPGKLRGVNIAGAEFDGFAFYATPEAMDYHDERSVKIIRFPHLWERMQADLYGAVEGDNADDYLTMINYALSIGMYVVVDIHNYARRDDIVIGTPTLPVAAYLDYLEKLVAYLPADPKIILCSMNEPHGIGARYWADISKTALDHLRAAGWRNNIQVAGIQYTGAHSWISSGTAAAYEDFRDPLNFFTYDAHQYLDSNNSGTTGTCSVGSADRVDAFIAWLEAAPTVRKGFIGETSAGAPTEFPDCGTEFPDMLDKLEASASVIGYTAWDGGNYWSADYDFRLVPPTLDLAPNTEVMDILIPYFELPT